MPAHAKEAANRRWLSGRLRRIGAGIALLAFLSTNLLAYFHARAMTTYSVAGSGTASPERLSTFEKANVLLRGVNLARPANDRTPADFGLAYETCAIRGNTGLDLEAWRIPCGQARALVLMFHGYGACKATLLPEARALNELGCETLLVDFRGSGGSSGNVTTLGVYEADDVALCMEFARPLASGRPLILYGRSMGSAAILRAVAVHELQLDGAILECPFDRLVTTVGNRFSAMGLPAFPMAQLLVFWGGVQHGMNGFAHNPADYATSVRCPTLVLHGRLDPRVSVTEVQAVHANLAGEKYWKLFPHAAHESYLTVDPARWQSAVSAYLASFEQTPD